MACYFRAYMKHSGNPVEVEVFAENHVHGFTPLERGEELSLPIEGQSPWFAMLGNSRISQGMVESGQHVELALTAKDIVEVNIR